MSQKWNEIPAGTLLTATQNLWGALGNDADRVAEQLKRDSSFVRRAGAFLLSGGIKESAGLELARYIMDKNFWEPTDWAVNYAARFTKSQLCEVGKFPWGEDVLNSACLFPKCGKIVRDCHFAFVGLEKLNGQPLTMLKLQELHPASGQPRFASYAPSSCYAQQKFATEKTMGLRWYLLHIHIVPNSTSTAWSDQLAMLPAEYEVPTAVTETAKDLLVYRKTGVYPNLKVYARVDDTTSDGRRVDVGCCGYSDGVDVDCWGDDDDYYLGLAVSRKLPARPLNT